MLDIIFKLLFIFFLWFLNNIIDFCGKVNNFYIYLHECPGQFACITTNLTAH